MSKIDFAVGGQAVIEGVMMRSPNHYTVSVRDEHGKIHMQQAVFKSLVERHGILKWPLIRGIVHLGESMMIGFRALDYSNKIFLGEDLEDEVEKSLFKRSMAGLFAVFYVVGTLAFTLFLLKFLPLWVAEKAGDLWPVVQDHYLLFNAIDGVTKITIFLGYVALISLMKDIRRVFQYHGAEHKSIWTYEKGLPLTVENARKQTRFHPRCGTSFIVIVIAFSILVYTLLPPVDGFWAKLLERLAVIPLIAGGSYEVLKVSAKFQNHFIVKLFIWPGLLTQRLTTREPDDAQLEIALHSLKASLEVENELVP